MELRHVKYFLAVAEELHFGRAAKRLHIAQPPLSQQIKQLEDELGVVLFYRTNHKVTLAPAGELFLPHARDLLERAQASIDVVRQSARGKAGTIIIGYVDEAVHFVLPRVITGFQALYPGVQFTLTEMHSAQQVQALEEGRIHFGFGYSPGEGKNISCRPVLRGPIKLALPSCHALARQASVKLSDCRSEPFIFPVRASSPALYDFMLAFCSTRGLVPDIRYTAEHVYTVMGFVRANLGVTLFPGFMQDDEWPGVVTRPITGKASYMEMYASWNNTHKPMLLSNFREVMFGGAAKQP